MLNPYILAAKIAKLSQRSMNISPKKMMVVAMVIARVIISNIDRTEYTENIRNKAGRVHTDSFLRSTKLKK